MSSEHISVAVVDFSNGMPDPYNFNDAMHVVNSNDESILWDWVDVQKVGKPTHYVIHNGHLGVVGHDTESIIPIVMSALAIASEALDNDLEGEHYVNDHETGILSVDLDGADGTEVQFKLISHPGIWIYCVWRG